MNIELKDKNGITLKTAGKYCSEDVGIVPKLQSKSVATNGSVVADEGYCGLDSVTVDVPATPTQEKTVDLAMASGDQTITPTSGKVFSQVVVKKPATMLPENIKKDINIGGVTGTLEGGAKLNIAYGDTPPEDTSKLWIKSEEPSNISFPIEWTPEQIAEEGGLTDIGVLEYPSSGIAAAAVADKIYLFGGYGFNGKINKIYQFTDEVPLSSDNIVVTQKDYSLTFTLLKSPTEVELGCKNVYKGDQSLAKFIDAYVYDGVNWANVNTNDVTFTKLYAPKISISGKTLTITNDGRNGSKVTNYKVYNGSTLLTTITATTLDLTTVITANGTYNISVIATGTGYTDSNNSNVVEYNYGVYNITTNLTNVTANASNPTTVSTVASSTLTFTANTGYNLPDNVTVTGAEFTWTKSSGTLVLSNPTGAVSVTVAGVAISRTITPTLTNVTAASGNATTIATGETKVLTYTAASGYTLPDSVTVTGATGVWNKDAGTLTLSNPTANVTFTITGVEATSSGYQLIVTEFSDGGYASIKYKDGTSAKVRAGTYQNVVSIQGVDYIGSLSQYYTLTDLSGNTHSLPYTLTSNTTIEIGSEPCIIEGTQITLADGTSKAIEDITYDDKLLVWNFYAGRFDTAKPKWIKVEQTTPRYCLVKFSNGAEVGFVGPGEHTRQSDGGRGYHRIFNKEAGAFTYVGTEETPNGTTTFAQDETFPTVISQEVVEKEVKFYNVITDKHYNIFANGILTSCRLSNEYKIEDMKYVGERLITDKQIEDYFYKIQNKKQ